MGKNVLVQRTNTSENLLVRVKFYFVTCPGQADKLSQQVNVGFTSSQMRSHCYQLQTPVDEMDRNFEKGVVSRNLD